MFLVGKADADTAFQWLRVREQQQPVQANSATLHCFLQFVVRGMRRDTLLGERSLARLYGDATGLMDGLNSVARFLGLGNLAR